MKKIGLGLVLAGWAGLAGAGVIWIEDFASVDDWTVISNPSNTAAVASDGNLASFSEQAPGMLWPNGSAFGNTDRIPFNPAERSRYTLSFVVAKISNSMSFDLALDCFTDDRNYKDTVWAVFPNMAFVGTTNLLLETFDFPEGTAYVSPKLTLHTGEGGQAVQFDMMSISKTP